MSKHWVDFADADTALGVRYVILRRYADQRGCSVDELINLVMADFLGYRPPEDEEDEEWERAYRRAGIPKRERRPLKGLKELQLRLEEDNSGPPVDDGHL